MDISKISSNTTEMLLQWQNGRLVDEDDQTAKSSTNKNTSAYSSASMTEQVSGMVELVKYIMDAMGASSDSRVTFKHLDKYREQLLSEFNQGVNDGLTALGVTDPGSLKFTLRANDDGTVTVTGDCPDKDKIQNFFDNNPDMIKKYRQIEALKGIDAARQALEIPASEMRKRVQIESMAAWWNSSDTASSYFGSYNNNGLSLLDSLNITV